MKKSITLFKYIKLLSYLKNLQGLKALESLLDIFYLLYIANLSCKKTSKTRGMRVKKVKKREDYGFTSKELDEETNLYYFGARYLDPQTSRWISCDPALVNYLPTGNKEIDEDLPGEGGVFNPVNIALYTYAANNPVKYIDPNGLANEKTKKDPIIFRVPLNRKNFKDYMQNYWGSKKEARKYKFATFKAKRFFRKFARYWNKKHKDNPIFVGDFSQRGGGKDPNYHNGYHHNGMNFDIKYMTTDGEYHSGNYNSSGSNYDRALTIELITELVNFDDRGAFKKFFNIGKSSMKIRYILFNDPNTHISSKVRSYPGHADHIDIMLEPNY